MGGSVGAAVSSVGHEINSVVSTVTTPLTGALSSVPIVGTTLAQASKTGIDVASGNVVGLKSDVTALASNPQVAQVAGLALGDPGLGASLLSSVSGSKTPSQLSQNKVPSSGIATTVQGSPASPGQTLAVGGGNNIIFIAIAGVLLIYLAARKK